MRPTIFLRDGGARWQRRFCRLYDSTFSLHAGGRRKKPKKKRHNCSNSAWQTCSANRKRGNKSYRAMKRTDSSKNSPAECARSFNRQSLTSSERRIFIGNAQITGSSPEWPSANVATPPHTKSRPIRFNRLEHGAPKILLATCLREYMLFRVRNPGVGIRDQTKWAVLKKE